MGKSYAPTNYLFIFTLAILKKKLNILIAEAGEIWSLAHTTPKLESVSRHSLQVATMSGDVVSGLFTSLP